MSDLEKDVIGGENDPCNHEVQADLSIYDPHKCPNCGGDDLMVTGAYSGREEVYKIQCRKCHVSGCYCRDIDLAAADWNERKWWRRGNETGKVLASWDAKYLRCNPCPVCGGWNLQIVKQADKGVRLRCADCHISTDWTMIDTDTAIRAWKKGAVS